MILSAVTDILVIIQEREDVRKTLANLAERLGLTGMEILAVPEDSEDFGTAESIHIALQAKKITVRKIQKYIRGQDIFLGCNFLSCFLFF